MPPARKIDPRGGDQTGSISAGGRRLGTSIPGRLSRLGVDDQFKFRRLMKRNIQRFRALEVDAFTARPAWPCIKVFSEHRGYRDKTLNER